MQLRDRAPRGTAADGTSLYTQRPVQWASRWYGAMLHESGTERYFKTWYNTMSQGTVDTRYSTMLHGIVVKDAGTVQCFTSLVRYDTLRLSTVQAFTVQWLKTLVQSSAWCTWYGTMVHDSLVRYNSSLLFGTVQLFKTLWYGTMFHDSLVRYNP